MKGQRFSSLKDVHLLLLRRFWILRVFLQLMIWAFIWVCHLFMKVRLEETLGGLLIVSKPNLHVGRRIASLWLGGLPWLSHLCLLSLTILCSPLAFLRRCVMRLRGFSETLSGVIMMGLGRFIP